MARYYFNLHDGSGLIEDEEGRDLAGMAQVRVEALKGARSIIADEALHGRIDLTGRLEVMDAEGKLVLALEFREAIEIVT